MTILLTVLSIFPELLVGRFFLQNQGMSSLVIISLILLTCIVYHIQSNCKEKLHVGHYWALGQCLLILKYFCTVYDYAGKADLSKGCGNPKRK